jgi:tetratricopeptide (TPR) repeat protein
MRVLLWSAIAAGVIFAGARLAESPLAPDLPPPRAASGAPGDYGTALARLDTELRALEQLTASPAAGWLMDERIAQYRIRRARLTGSFKDYADAQQALDRGFAAAPPGAGPHISQAALAISLHRLALAERMLDAVDRYAVPGDAEARAVTASLRSDIAFYRGQYRAAVKGYRTLPQPAERLAIFHARTGRPHEAHAMIRLIERRGLVQPEALARLALLRGVVALQTGDWDGADAAFEEADRRFPGWWLVGAHRAQMLALRGRHDEAIRAFEALAAQSSDPMLRDALASLYRARGGYSQARSWGAQAAQGWAERLRLLPEAALGHAAEHELAFGTPARALELARRDFTLRPHGATAVTLGWALVANNRAAEALRLMSEVNRLSWRSAEQHLVSARAHALLGQGEAAREAEAKALAINPRALDANAALLWFGH